MTLKKKAHNFFKKMAINTIRARRMRAAQFVAYHLVHNNKDFRDSSPYELAQRIAKRGTVEEILGSIK